MLRCVYWILGSHRGLMRDSKTVTAEYRNPLGATTFNENVCSFLVWAPRASKVEIVVSEPRDREILMQAVGCGYFHAFVEDIAAGALYRYRLNDEKERPDPASRSQPQGVHGPSQIVDSRFGVAFLSKNMFSTNCT